MSRITLTKQQLIDIVVALRNQAQQLNFEAELITSDPETAAEQRAQMKRLDDTAAFLESMVSSVVVEERGHAS